MLFQPKKQRELKEKQSSFQKEEELVFESSKMLEVPPNFQKNSGKMAKKITLQC